MTEGSREVSVQQLSEYIDACRTFDLQRFQEQVAPAFLLLEVELESKPIGEAQSTMGLVADTRQKRLASQLDFAVFPLRKTNRSRFSQFVSLGRAFENDVVLQHTSVSSFHAFFTPNGDSGFLLQDGGSKNGTFVDDEPAPARDAAHGVLLRSGQLVRFGDIELTYLGAPEFRSLAERVSKIRP